jgi:hypothetical protein
MGLTPKYMIKVDSARLGRCLVKDENGDELRLSTLWKEKAAIIVFLRHFACIACRAHAAQVWSEREKYELGGAKLAFVGNGSADYILRFKTDLGIKDATIYTDPVLRSFTAAGFKRGFFVSHGPKSVKNGIKLMSEGHSQKLPGAGAGDLWQLGGLLVVLPDGRVTYQFISEALGDFPPEKDTAHIIRDEEHEALFAKSTNKL